MKVNITYEIPSQRVADLVITAVEGGCNYWCNGLFRYYVASATSAAPTAPHISAPKTGG